MTSLPNRDEKQLQELLAGKVLGDLSNEELQEFGERFSTIHSKDLQELELTVAALQLALVDPVESFPSANITRADVRLPDSLRQKITEDAGRYIVPATNPSALVARIDEAKSIQNPALNETKVLKERRERSAWRETAAWLAVVASSLIAVQLWFSSPSKNGQATQASTAAELRLALLNSSAKLIRADWTNGKTPFENSVTGDVVWNNESQQGFMRFVGLPQNIPTQEQYQLWIIDPDRDAEPIDGGVFDISSDGEVVIPIQAKLKVLKPAAFAITIEKPGGVVVSTQERLPLLASVSN